MNAQRINDLVGKAYRGDADAKAKATREIAEMCSFHDSLLLDVKMLEGAISHGRLDIRADPAKYSGENRKIIESMNATLDAATSPLKMSIECTDQLSRGILPEKITRIGYGDINRFTNNLNNCIDTFAGLKKENGNNVWDKIYYVKTPGTLNGNSNFSERIDDTAHMQGNVVAMKNPVTNASAVLPGVLSTISREVSEIAAHNQRTKKSTTKLAADTAQVARSAGVVHFNAEQGDKNVREIFNGMKELSRGIREISKDTDAVSRLAKKTYDLSGSAADHAVRIKDGLTGISHTSGEVDAHISDLLLLVDRIGDNTSHILMLSDRAKLLAVHASPVFGEPANFLKDATVSASEVKFLADASRESAKKMAALVTELQNKSRLAKSALENLNNEVTTGNAAFSETSELLLQVAGSVEQISRNMEEVLTTSKVQEKSVTALTAQVQQVNYRVRGTAEKASDVAKACKDTSTSLYRVAQDMAVINRHATNVTSGTAKYQ